MNERTALYRLFDTGGRLLYVGISNDPGFRWKQHQSVKPWWRQVADKQVAWYDTRVLAFQAEALAIHTESPVHNTVKPHLIPQVPERFTSTSQPSDFDRLLRETAERRALALRDFEECDGELRDLIIQGRATGHGPSHMARLTGFTRDWVSRLSQR
jgi:hypothetical protein